jgi:hypothetical protein
MQQIAFYILIASLTIASPGPGVLFTLTNTSTITCAMPWPGSLVSPPEWGDIDRRGQQQGRSLPPLAGPAGSENHRGRLPDLSRQQIIPFSTPGDEQ